MGLGLVFPSDSSALRRLGRAFSRPIRRIRAETAGFDYLDFGMGGPRLDRIFYTQDDVVPDVIGRTLHGRILGNLVRFRLAKHIHRGQQVAKATYVESVFGVDTAGVANHREVSIVNNIVTGSHRPIASVFLKRSSGDKLYLGYDGVAEAHQDQVQHLKLGDHVWHGVAPPLGNQRTWRATVAEFYSDNEEAAMLE